MISSNELSLNWYLNKTIDLLEMSPLENQFQNFIVYPILDSIIQSSEIQELKLIDCHNFRQYNTGGHNRCKYSVLVKAIPDLIIAKDFFYYNRNEQTYEALKTVTSIEVKAPNNKWMLDKCVTSPEVQEEYDDKLYVELLPSLYKNKKAILTNIRKWDFFDVSKVTDPDLIEQIRLYMKILELCGFDSYRDYERIISCTEDGEKSRKKGLKKTVISERWNELKEIEVLKEIMESFGQEIEENNFCKIVKFADDMYIKAIKRYIQSAKTKSVDIITSKGILKVNRFNTGNNIDEGITSIDDLKYNCSKWNELLKEIKNLISL